MNRFLLALIWGSFASSAAWAASDADFLLVTSQGVRNEFVDDRGRTWTDNTQLSLSQQATSAANTLKSLNPRGLDVVVVGHSMGGVRALGIAKADSNVKAVLTIGSPIKGFSPLLEGVPRLQQKSFLIGRTVVSGLVDAWKYDTGLLTMLPVSFGSVTGAASDLFMTNWIITTETLGLISKDARKLARMVPAVFVSDPFVRNILIENEVGPAVKDMTPGSGYLEANVMKNNPAQGEYRRVPRFPYPVLYWDGPWYHLRLKTKWVWYYETVWVETKAAWTDSRVDSQVVVRNIVGTENDPEKLLGGAKKSLDQLSDRLEVAAGGYGGLATVSGISAAGLWAGSFVNPGAIPAAIAFTAATNGFLRQRENCLDARAYTAKPGRAIGEILGSTAHDGAIPQRDQYNLLMGGRNPAGSPDVSEVTYDSRVVEVRKDHREEELDPEIWGTEGSLKKGVGDGGKVRQFLGEVYTVEAINRSKNGGPMLVPKRVF